MMSRRYVRGGDGGGAAKSCACTQLPIWCFFIVRSASPACASAGYSKKLRKSRRNQQTWAIEASPGPKVAYRGVVSFYSRLYTVLLKHWEIVLVTLCIRIKWLFYNTFWCEPVPQKWRRLHKAQGHVLPLLQMTGHISWLGLDVVSDYAHVFVLL